MFKQYLILAGLIFISGITYSQSLDMGTMPRIGMGANTNPNDNVSSLSVRKTTMPAEHFLENEWAYGDITYDGGGKFKTLPIKFDLLNSYVLIKADDGSEKVLPFSRLDTAVVKRDDFTRSLFVKEVVGTDGVTPKVGFFEVVPNVENNYALVYQYEVDIVKPNQKMAMDASRREASSRLKTENFIIYKGKLYPVLTNKKKFVRQFAPEDQLVIDQKLDEWNINLKSRASMLLFVKSLE